MKRLFDRTSRSSTSACRASPTTSTAAGGQVTQLAWAPPAGADAALGWTLAILVGDPRVEEANRDRLTTATSPRSRVLVDLVLAPARRSPALAGRTAHPARRSADRLGRHVRPAAGRDRRRDPLRRLGRRARGGARSWRQPATWRSSRATTTARSGRWPASSARRCRCGWSRTPTAGNRAYCNLNEGLGKVLRFGANAPEVIERLRWLGAEFFEVHAGRRRAASPDSNSSR